jgi:hypothetical protein
MIFMSVLLEMNGFAPQGQAKTIRSPRHPACFVG